MLSYSVSGITQKLHQNSDIFHSVESKKKTEKDNFTPFFFTEPARGLHRESMMAHDDSTVFLFGPLSPWTYLLHANEGGMADHGINPNLFTR